MNIQKILVILSILALLLLAGCANRAVKPPSLEFSQLSLISEPEARFALKLQLRNPVKVPYTIDKAEISMRLDDRFNLKGSQTLDLPISRNGTEAIEIELVKADATKLLLRSLIQGNRQAIPYTAETTLYLTSGKIIRQEHKGRFFKIPGKTWQFRG